MLILLDQAKHSVHRHEGGLASWVRGCRGEGGRLVLLLLYHRWVL